MGNYDEALSFTKLIIECKRLSSTVYYPLTKSVWLSTMQTSIIILIKQQSKLDLKPTFSTNHKKYPNPTYPLKGASTESSVKMQ